ncbi:MFS transporter, partial [Streptomyces sp. NPDC005877]
MPTHVDSAQPRDSRLSLRDHPSFRAYWLGEATALAGSSVSAVALPVIAAMELDATPGQVSALASAVMAPGFLLALPAGVVGDRSSKKRLMVSTDLAAAAVVAVVPACWAADALTMPVLCCVAFLLGSLTVLHQAAAIAIVPELVVPELVPDANARVMAAFAVAGSAGAYGGIAAVNLLGAVRCLLLDSASYLISAWCASRISSVHTAQHPARPRTGMITSIREGMAHVLRDPLQRPLVLTMAYHAFAEGIVTTYFAYYLLTELDYGDIGLGLVLGAVGVGSLVGALVAGRLVRRIGPGAVLFVGFAAYPICGAPLLVARPGHGWWIALVA